MNGEKRATETQTKSNRTTLLARGFAPVADRAAHVIGQPQTFIVICVVIAFWAVANFFLHFSYGWQPIVNAVTIVTFLIVFLIQSTQNRNGAAIQAKLDELIRALEPAENKFMGIEKLTIEEVRELREECVEDVRILEAKVEATLEECDRHDAAREPCP